MHTLLAGLLSLVVVSLLVQLIASEAMRKTTIPLVKLAVGLWIIQFLLQLA